MYFSLYLCFTVNVRSNPRHISVYVYSILNLNISKPKQHKYGNTRKGHFHDRFPAKVSVNDPENSSSVGQLYPTGHFAKTSRSVLPHGKRLMTIIAAHR